MAISKDLSPPPSINKIFDWKWINWLYELYEYVRNNVARDFYFDIAAGLVNGHSVVHKFGRNDAVPNGSWAHVNQLGSANWRLTAATTIRIKAGGNAADTAAGTGAREVTVQGLDANGNLQTVSIATNGASASTATTETFIRLFRVQVSSAGSGGVNAGNIIIENGGGGTDLIQVTAGEGQSQFGAYTIPKGKTGYVTSLLVSVDAAAGKNADIRVFAKDEILDVTAPITSDQIKLYFDGVSGVVSMKPATPFLNCPELTDIWFEANGAGASTEVSVDFEIILVDN